MRRWLLAGLVFGCGSDEPAPPPAPEPKVEPARAPGPGIGKTVAKSIEVAHAGGERATDLDAAFSGTWTGEYAYAAGARDAVELELDLVVRSGKLTGSSTEPNTFVRPGPTELSADLLGEVLRGGDFALMKTYTGAADHSVLYVGHISTDRRTLEGRWQTRGVTGTFALHR